MLSRRDYFAIFLMMATVFFIFQFSLVMKAQGNEYDVNEHVVEVELKASDVPVVEAEKKVWFVGDIEGPVGDAVRQWCTYTRQQLEVFSEIPEPITITGLEAIVIDPKTVDIKNKTDKLLKLTELRATMIFGDLPDAAYIDSDEELKKLLGITKVVQPAVHVEGVQIFSGFLLGGETVYAVNKDVPEEKRFEDLDLDIAWYDTGLGTKTYIVGVMDEDLVHPYDFPKMIWRSYYNGTFIYAVNGDYLQGMMGIGFLDSMMYDTKEYYIYPVVNANNIVFADFPYLSNENSEELKKIYARDAEGFQRDIAWPGIISMATRSEFCMTCFLSERFDHDHEAEISRDETKFYLQQMKELDAEAGRSLDYKGSISLTEKAELSRKYFLEEGINYRFRSLYIKEWKDEMKDILDNQEPDIRTVVSSVRNNNQAISFCSDNVTIQYATNKADEYTFKNALLYRSLLTSLGYTNVLVDMSQVIWPGSEDDEWQNFFDHVFSYVTSYWSDWMVFDATTISESDARIRKMLSVKYSDEKKDDKTIVLHTSGADENYFIIRLHDTEITGISDNAEYTRIEKDSYLLKVKPGDTTITVRESEEVFHYDGPFD
ncbi:MAG: DUF2194 domain-containing protein [Lachnospiraceae bacterium]|nr:DUF2194 domain-containing protein [Lachnospiraceae bacterium]